MPTISFDTYKFIVRLHESGLEEKQAEAIVEAFKEAKNEIQPINKNYFDYRLEENKNGIIKWIAGLLIAQAALVATLIKLFSISGN